MIRKVKKESFLRGLSLDEVLKKPRRATFVGTVEPYDYFIRTWDGGLLNLQGGAFVTERSNLRFIPVELEIQEVL